MKDNATPRPWHVQPVGNALRVIGGPPFYRKVAELPGGRWTDVELIVEAVNAHADLVDACKVALAELGRLTGEQGFEPERFAERLGAVWTLQHALAKVRES